ncbi:MAG: hypothetical protein B6D64_13515 [Bacteroidetes bacterium 4484_276]|nr:MAG: hypothetical protein B6D64_13515 [Bacteroidetes bacterium 4484_276]
MDKIILHSTSLADFKFIIGEEIRQQMLAIIPEYAKKRPDRYLTRKEAAEKLRMTLVTLDKYTKEGLIPAYRIGNQIRYKSNELEEVFEAVKNKQYRRG